MVQTDDRSRIETIRLRYLATGDSYRTLMYGFIVPQNTISGIIRNVCKAIVATYAGDIINTPTEPEQWEVITEKFRAKWQFNPPYTRCSRWQTCSYGQTLLLGILSFSY